MSCTFNIVTRMIKRVMSIAIQAYLVCVDSNRVESIKKDNGECYKKGESCKVYPGGLAMMELNICIDKDEKEGMALHAYFGCVSCNLIC